MQSVTEGLEGPRQPTYFESWLPDLLQMETKTGQRKKAYHTPCLNPESATSSLFSDMKIAQAKGDNGRMDRLECMWDQK